MSLRTSQTVDNASHFDKKYPQDGHNLIYNKVIVLHVHVLQTQARVMSVL